MSRQWVLSAAVLIIALMLVRPARTQSPVQTPPAAPEPLSELRTEQNNSIPDAPSAVQTSSAAQEASPPEIAKPEPKKPVERDPWTNKPINKNQDKSGAWASNSPNDSSANPPPTPPVKTLPPGSSTKQGDDGSDQLTAMIRVHANFVQIPVTVKDKHGRPVDDLHAADFTVKENEVPQKLSFFSSDPFALSVAVILDLGMPDVAVQQMNTTLPALFAAFAPYDEISLYTYSSTVSQVSDFTGPSRKLEALVARMETQRGRPNGPPVLGGPLGPNGPVINNIPVGQPTEAVNTPPKESNVLNDAILQGALGLGKRPRDRRKIIFVISDGREYGSKARYRDVLRVLLSREIEVMAVGVEGAAVPLLRHLEQYHIPLQARSDILPKYVHATGGGQVYSELSAKVLEGMYAEAMMETRNQYTLGYTPTAPKVPNRSPYREIEVVVHRSGLKVTAKDGYYPAPAPR